MVTVPPIITNLALFCACVLGIATILFTLTKPPGASEEGANLKFKGINLGLTGRAVFQLFLGAVLLVSPILTSSLVRASVVPQGLPYQKVDKLDDPEYVAFKFIRDVSIVDLRSSKSEPLLSWIPTFGRQTNPATLLNTMIIKKVAGADVISFKYSTSGTANVRCLNNACSIKRADESAEFPGQGMKQAWELTASVKDVPVGSDFEMIVEVTFWNAFDTPEKQWYATYSNNQRDPETLGVLLIFPDKSPFTKYETLIYHEDSKVFEPFTGSEKIVPGLGNQSVYWEIPNAEASRTYRINWTY
jgi:hypothetical protein